jgi:hypothetical protein
VPGQSWLADILARIAAMPQIGLMRPVRGQDFCLGLTWIAEKDCFCQMDGNRRRSRLLPGIQPELLRLFVAGVPASTATELTGVNRKIEIWFQHETRICQKNGLVRQWARGESLQKTKQNAIDQPAA